MKTAKLGNFFIAIGLLVLFFVPAAAASLASDMRSGNNVTADEPDFYNNISIDTIPIHQVNDTITISGTTTLPVGTELMVTIIGDTYVHSINLYHNRFNIRWFYDLPKKAFVKTNFKNETAWEYTINTTGSYPDDYLIYVTLPDADMDTPAPLKSPYAKSRFTLIREYTDDPGISETSVQDSGKPDSLTSTANDTVPVIPSTTSSQPASMPPTLVFIALGSVAVFCCSRGK